MDCDSTRFMVKFGGGDVAVLGLQSLEHLTCALSLASFIPLWIPTLDPWACSSLLPSQVVF